MARVASAWLGRVISSTNCTNMAPPACDEVTEVKTERCLEAIVRRLRQSGKMLQKIFAARCPEKEPGLPAQQMERNWRRGGDSNSRYPSGYVRFRGGSFQPLTHLSAAGRIEWFSQA